jgi:acyl-CoA reductase-like NAD-dependent aldehyde dehydrogenase
MEMLIDGKWIDKVEKIRDMNPYTQVLVGSVPKGNPKDVGAAFKAVSEARIRLSKKERHNLLISAAMELDNQLKEFSTLISMESGKPIKESKREVKQAIQILLLCAEESIVEHGSASEANITKALHGKIAISVREPLGVIAILTDYANPLSSVVARIAPVIASNNKAVLLPSEKAPLAGLMFMKILVDCGMPVNMVNAVTGYYKDIGELITTSPRANMVCFVGERERANSIAEIAGMKKLHFEIKGNNAMIILEDSDVENAAKIAVQAAFSASGQSPEALKHIIVMKSVSGEFIQQFVLNTKKLMVGDPLKENTDMGTMIDEDSSKEVEAKVKQYVDAGAMLMCGGERQGSLIWPAILQVPINSEVLNTRIDGPVVTVSTAENEAEVIKTVNAMPNVINIGLFTNTIELAKIFAQELAARVVSVNSYPNAVLPNMPTEGTKEGGFGRIGVRDTIDEMTKWKVILM